MVIQLCGFGIHDMLSRLHSVHPMQLRFTLICLLFRMFVNEQILDLASASRALIDCKSCCKLAMSADLDGIKHADREVLAIVGDYVISGSFLTHIMDCHLPSLTKGFVVEAGFADGEGVPFFSDDFLVDIDDIETFVLCNSSMLCPAVSRLFIYHPKFMSVIAH